MPSLYLLIPIAMVFCGLAIWAFFWALDNKQYKDIDREAHRILFDDGDPVLPETKKRTQEKEKQN